MSKDLAIYTQGLRYELPLSEDKPQLISATDKATFRIQGLTATVGFSLEGDQIRYDDNGQAAEMGDSLELDGVAFYRLAENERIIDLLDKQELYISSKVGSDFQVENADTEVVLQKEETHWYLTLLAGSLYVNNVQLTVKSMQLSFGDELSFGPVLFKFLGDEVRVKGPVTVIQELIEKTESNHTFYEEYPDYHRSPRIIYRSSEDTIAINAPAKEPNKPQDGLLRMIVPPLIMVSITILISLIQPRGLYILVTMGMSIVTVIFSITSYFKNRKQYKSDLRERIASYHRYLSDKAIELHALAQEQEQGQLYHYPAIETLDALSAQYHHRIYEKTPLHFDFLYYRLGLGNVPTTYSLKYTQTERSGQTDPLEAEGYALYLREREISDMPIVANLAHGPVGYIGPRPLVLEQLQLMVNQLAFFHSYHDVQFVTILPEEELPQWEWMRWLPHATLQDMNVRGFVYNQRTRDQVLNSLTQILKLRRSQQESKEVTESTLFSPHYVVLVTDEKLILDHVIMEFFTEDPTALGCSIIFVEDVLSSLSENIKTIVNIKDRNYGQLVMEEGELKEVNFALDHFPQDYDKEAIARRLAPLNHLQNLKSSIPEVVTFLEMYGAEKVDDLAIPNRWSAHAPYKSLAVPIGLRGQDDHVMLNLHEKAHGPHGLIAGTTGSGKSEVIQSYILSLAVNFHPHDVAFLLIDYKGGGMANLFKDLPHLLGTITNLDGAQSMRALVSINAELNRRQRLFAQYEVNHINQYQKKYKSGQVPEPMPHLFLISDEFAELKTNQPDFMKELVSTARIGRSLGIHLILATQKPSGVVDAQIWSNSRFRVALKVADRQDSNEMLHTPDAAEITQVGRGYLQVGNNEVYELFQSAWSGADYQSDKDEQGIVDHTIYRINKMGQYEILNEDLSGLEEADTIKEVSTELDAVVKGIQAISEQLHIKSLPQPWLSPLRERITINELREAEPNWETSSRELIVTIGQADIPSRQAQEIATINLTKDGNILLYGSTGTGKTTFLQTVVMDLAENYSPDSVNFYLLDFGANGLAPLRDLPHVADYISLEQTEKIEKFIRLFEKEIARRKKILAQSGMPSIDMYRSVSQETLPNILVVLDGYEAVKDEKFETNLFKLLTRVAREGLSIGLHVVMTASRQTNLRAVLYSNFKHQLSLRQNDTSDVTAAVGRTELAAIEDIKGRALMKRDASVDSIQFALPVKVENDRDLFDALREAVKQLSRKWHGAKPKPIPMVPDELMIKEYLHLPAIESIHSKKRTVTFGLELEMVEPVEWDFQLGNLAYIYEHERHRENILQLVVSELEQTNIPIRILASEETKWTGGTRISNSDASRLLMIDEIYDTINESIEFGVTIDLEIIVWDRIYELSNSSLDVLTKIVYILQKGPKVGIYSFVMTTPALSSKNDSVSTYIKQSQYAIVQTRLNDQKVLSLSNVKYNEPALPETYAYLVKNKVYEQIKVPTGE